jgi:hypothetical protein
MTIAQAVGLQWYPLAVHKLDMNHLQCKEFGICTISCRFSKDDLLLVGCMTRNCRAIPSYSAAQKMR